MHPSLERLPGLRAARAEQLVIGEESDELLHFVEHGTQRGLGAHVGDQRGRIRVLAPAREQLELEPADFVEGVANRVEDAPGRRTVLLRGSRIEAQILTDEWQREHWLLAMP